MDATTNDMIALMADLQACLARADKLDLPMVAIHLEQARSWIADHAPASGGGNMGFTAAPRSFS
ncbi:hypothetical protein [Sphingomonas fuzhouensis]|uniref:hypothetical protein n=1 Tax=Sphingomonas fuzhouensis TaxID=3106033 RepID=UPI002AFE0C17|nr:hypothetical protein [Sphingomonas sp. SGZ-02]